MRKYLEEMRGMLAKRRPTTNMLLNKQCALKGVLYEILCVLGYLIWSA
jgi:hypothetical protein